MPSHKALSNWYTQLAQHLEAGVPLPETLRLCEGMPEKGRSALANALDRGTPLNQVMAHAPNWLPKADRQFIEAGAQTGALPQTMHNLSVRHGAIGATQLKLFLGLAYPLFVLHMAALMLPVVGMIDFESGFNWDAAQWLTGSLRLLLPLWILGGVLLWLARVQHPALAALMRVTPILRQYALSQKIADFAHSLGTFIAAGVPVPDAWRRSVAIVNDSRYQKALAHLEPGFARGDDPKNSLKDTKTFPADFIAFYRTGSESGKLDENLFIIGRQYQERANHAMTLAAIIYPTLFFLVIAGFVVVSIFNLNP